MNPCSAPRALYTIIKRRIKHSVFGDIFISVPKISRVLLRRIQVAYNIHGEAVSDPMTTASTSVLSSAFPATCV